MATKDLNNYGICRKIFKGNGVARFSNKSQVKVRFTLAQLVDTQLMFVVDFKSSIRDFIDHSIQITDFIGTLKDGRKVKAEGLLTIENKLVSGEKAKLIGYVSEWTIGELDNQEPTSITFDLVNFRYIGTENQVLIEENTRHSTLSLMTLEIAQRQIKLQWVPDYERVVAILSAQHGVQVTCTATSAIRDTTDIDLVIEIIDTLCDVMTVARGTLVSWTSFDVMVKDSKLPYSRYRDLVTRPFVGIELISSNECQNTKLFLERGFQDAKIFLRISRLEKLQDHLQKLELAPFSKAEHY